MTSKFQNSRFQLAKWSLELDSLSTQATDISDRGRVCPERFPVILSESNGEQHGLELGNPTKRERRRTCSMLSYAAFRMSLHMTGLICGFKLLSLYSVCRNGSSFTDGITPLFKAIRPNTIYKSLFVNADNIS